MCMTTRALFYRALESVYSLIWCLCHISYPELSEEGVYRDNPKGKREKE